MLYAPCGVGRRANREARSRAVDRHRSYPVATMLHECSVPTRAIFLLDPQHQYVTKQRSPWQTFGMVHALATGPVWVRSRIRNIRVAAADL